jgi:hypothetical protein
MFDMKCCAARVPLLAMKAVHTPKCEFVPKPVSIAAVATFQRGVAWREPGVIIEMPEEEIEQMLLTGECETLEFREKLDKSRPERLAKTVTAFANTESASRERRCFHGSQIGSDHRRSR